jgi:hypothetical protein
MDTGQRAIRTAGVVAALLGLTAAFGCSGGSASTATLDASPAVDGSVPCNENPWECPAGQTCWPVTGTTFACLPSGGGQSGAPCALDVGVATCTDGLNCLETTGTGMGICSPFCDATHACPATSSCEGGYLPDGGATFNVCVPQSNDGGATTEAAASDAIADAESTQ